MDAYLELRREMKRRADLMRPEITRSGKVLWPMGGGARQYLQDGPYIDPPVASGSALTSTSAEDLWLGTTFTPIFANDPKAGKIYTVEAGGIMSFASTGALTITPTYGGSAGVALGASQAQTTPGATTAQPWYLRFNLIFRTIGAAGTNSTAIGTGFFTTAGTTSASSSVVITFGGTSASVDATVNKDIHIRKTLSVAGSMTMQYAYIFSLN